MVNRIISRQAYVPYAIGSSPAVPEGWNTRYALTDVRPDPEHDAVCASDARHRVVVAPPSTGKTHLSVRLAGLFAKRIAHPSKVLLLTFSNQAQTQLEREAVRQLTPEVRQRVEITNYHRFFWHGVRAYR